jgi:branched-chain amino acid transport system substrate-binding protein
MRFNRFLHFAGIANVCIITLLLQAGCLHKDPIKIGFAGGLTGRHADLGIYGRNGALLAIEEVNNTGGIAGRQLELLVKDDEQNAVIARKVDQELIDEGVVAIIGHFTSAMSVAAVPLINREKVLMLSPTTSTNELSGIDDYFIRIMSPNLQATNALAQHLFASSEIQTLVVTYDDQNRAFGIDWADFFVSLGKKLNKNIIVLPFDSRGDFKFSDLSKTVLTHKPDAVLVVAAALDAAMFCQQIRKIGYDKPISTTMWSMSNDFLQHGGAATEGVTFTNWFDPAHSSKSSQEFYSKYQARFGEAPTFASHFAYETATILIHALRKTDDPAKLKEVILAQEYFDGTQGKIRIDKFGDPERDFFIMRVENGKFVRINQW